MRLQRPLTTSAAIGALLLLAACGDEAGDVPDEQVQTTEPATTEPAATGTFHDTGGQEVGTVELTEGAGTTEVSVRVTGLEPGFHGLHVHDIGECEPDSVDPQDPESTGDFLSAGGHLNPDDADHGEHAGDLSSLLVLENGEAVLTTVTDRFTVADLGDADGTAFMVHSDYDNFAHIPERYGEPDADTLGTGDAGDRVACAVIE
ncbi:superoxide dismutase family protein [Georgenia sp. MJ170]|uniref:superoxide dismutase family protein n=1 Tax=Georgenia sunbinii TaxID=3117728 RepID=UPI002F267AF3